MTVNEYTEQEDNSEAPPSGILAVTTVIANGCSPTAIDHPEDPRPASPGAPTDPTVGTNREGSLLTSRRSTISISS
jgi:hypothetical protein